MAMTKLSLLLAVSTVHNLLASAYIHTKDTLDNKTYDYIVVGGGASGLTVANRLSEDPDVTVLIIEAGKFDSGEDFVTIPGLAGGAVGTGYDWNTTYIASESLNGRNVSIPQGKVVGGSTKLNRMVFDRGSKADYDRWEELGNEGWNWAALFPYFKKNEKFTPPDADIEAEYGITYDSSAHGSTGYMHSTYSPFIWPTTKKMIQAIDELDIGIATDQANGSPIGGYFCPHNQDPVTVERSSAREAYYDTAAKRQNLHIITGRQVTRLVLKKHAGEVCVTGVQYSEGKGASVETVSAKKEVVLAAGALHTPQLLQVSGIGDAAYLSSINVTTVVDLPSVGQNLHDHVLLTVVNSITAPLTSSNLTNNNTFAAEARSEYDNDRKGPLTSPTADFIVFLPLVNFTDASESIYNTAVDQNGTTFLPSDTSTEAVRGYEVQQQVLNEKLLSTDSAILELIWSDGAIVLGLQHPYSRGSVKAASSSVFDAPIADAGFLRNPLDVTILAEGVKFARKIAATSAVQSLSPVELVPGSNVTSDEALGDFVRSSASTLFHPAGSCKIGSLDEGGVVDSDLKVHGVNGLRIVDASVFPLLPASHTMTTVYAVAERAADLIKSSQ